MSAMMGLSGVGEILRSAQDDKSWKARRSSKQNALGAAALRRRGVRQRRGRNEVCNQVCHFAGKAGSCSGSSAGERGVFSGTFKAGNESF